MKTRIHRKRRVPPKRRASCTRRLSIEILEARLTLSFVGFGAGGGHKQVDSVPPPNHRANEVSQAPVLANNQSGRDRHEPQSHHDERRVAPPKPLAQHAPPLFLPSAPGPIVNPSVPSTPAVSTPPPSQTPGVSTSPGVGSGVAEAVTDGGSRAAGISLPLFDAFQVEVLVALTTTEHLNWWSRDSASLDEVFESMGRPSNFVRPSASSGVELNSESLPERVVLLSNSLFGATDNEGGLIEIERKRDSDLGERFESSNEEVDPEKSERVSRQMPRDEFWFDFEDDEFDSILDSTGVYKFTEEDVPTKPAGEFDEGGMIFLTNLQVTDEKLGGLANRLPGERQNQPSNRGKIPMAAGLGFYRAVEVATTLIDSPDDLPTADESELPAEGEATTDAVDPLPTLEQATSDSESDNAESTKAASTPFWLGAVAIFSRSRRKRKTKGMCLRTALRREQ